MVGGQGEAAAQKAKDQHKQAWDDLNRRLIRIVYWGVASIPLTMVVSYKLWQMLSGVAPDVECTFDLGNQCYRAVFSASELIKALLSDTAADSSSLLALKAAAGLLEGATNVACNVVGTAVCRAEGLVTHLAR